MEWSSVLPASWGSWLDWDKKNKSKAQAFSAFISTVHCGPDQPQWNYKKTAPDGLSARCVMPCMPDYQSMPDEEHFTFSNHLFCSNEYIVGSRWGHSLCSPAQFPLSSLVCSGEMKSHYLVSSAVGLNCWVSLGPSSDRYLFPPSFPRDADN